MNKLAMIGIKQTLSRGLHTALFQLKKHSPEIMMVTGVTGVIAGIVTACVATTKADEVVEEFNDTIERIHEDQQNAEMEGFDYPEYKKDLTRTYTKFALEMAKLYGPTVVIETVSIALICSSHVILKKRNVALAAAYTAIDNSFKNYRKNVKERFGEELDRELRYGIRRKEVQITDEKGNTTTETITVADTSTDNWNEYMRVFDDGNPGWDPNPAYTMANLQVMEQTANDILRNKGHLTLNEVYTMLGYPETKAGMVVGWKYDKKNPTENDYVSFGLMDIHREKTRDFINGYEKVLLLDFNVYGNIYNLF